MGNSAEGLLWQELKGRRLGGYHFTRQFPIGPYFADFACRSFMRAQGYSVLRFWNADVLKHRTAVCETILAALDGRLAENVTASDLRFVYAADPLTLNQRLCDERTSSSKTDLSS